MKNNGISTSQPNPEVVADAKRRTFTAEYKLRILAEADAAATQPGAIGALQRCEVLYSSHLVTWRRERQSGILKGLTPHKRGPKSKRSPIAEQLRKAEIVIDVQKTSGCSVGLAPAQSGAGRETLMDAVIHLALYQGVVAACAFLAVARASFYRQRTLLGPPKPGLSERTPPARSPSPEERAGVLAV